MATCTRCGQPAGLMHTLCDRCLDEREAGVAAPPSPLAWARPSSGVSESDKRTGLSAIGVLALAAGVYFLLHAEVPRESLGAVGQAMDTFNVPPVANLQRLIVGQTLALIGALFLGFAWRPLAR
jgi:hypothetical protein